MASTIQQFLREHGISEVEAIIPDMAGVARGKLMPAEKFAEEEGMRLPEAEVVWSRYVGAAVFSVIVARPWSRPQTFRANRPWLQFLRSALLLGSTYGNFLALRQLQLAETSTISFLTPLFVALMAGPWLGERVGGVRMAAIAVGFLGVVIATRPGTSAFQPIVFVAISGVVCNAGYGLATRMLAGRDSAETTLGWTPLAGWLPNLPAPRCSSTECLLPSCMPMPRRLLSWCLFPWRARAR